MAAEKHEKLEELRSRVKELKKARDDLNTKLRSKRDSVVGVYSEIDRLLKEAKTLKEARDKANKAVSEHKKKRDEVNAKIAELNKGLRGFKSQGTSSLSRRDYEKLKEEYKQLNWKHQTSPTSKQRETAMVRQLEEMEAQTKEYEAQKPVEKEAIKLEKELRKIRKEADASHMMLLKESETGEKAHGEMHEIYKKVDARREKAKKAETEFLEVKKQVDDAHDRFVEVLNELRTEEEKLGITRARDRRIEAAKFKKGQATKESDLIKELQKGRVIKTKDLLSLQTDDDNRD